MIKHWLKQIGPAPLIAAAFIGPGTVTVCTLAGVKFGYSLLWAMLLSILATIFLQEMAARLGIITQKGLSQVIRETITKKWIRVTITTLILAAIVIGNAAYEAGNISGGVLGLQTIAEHSFFNLFPLVLGVLAFILLYFSNYKVLEKVLVTLVILMSITFLVTAIIAKPNLSLIFKGLFIPKLSEANVLTVIALVGTTIVPYNLFLHASLVKEKWHKKTDVLHAKRDTIIAIAFGGLISMCIIICASAVGQLNINSAADLAKALEPLLGSFAKYVLSIGLFAAGLTSAITAPLAAAYVASGCLGWKSNLKDAKFRAVWCSILIIGVVFSSLEIKPVEIIKFAQVTNGLLLPIIVGLLLWITSKKSILGTYKNTVFQNIIGLVILILSIILGAKSILKVLEVI